MKNFFDRLNQGLIGDSQYLSPAENMARRRHMQFSMGANLLANAGPKPQGTSNMFSNLGSAMLASQNNADQYTTNALMAKLYEAQARPRMSAEMGDLMAMGIDPTTPEGQAKYEEMMRARLLAMNPMAQLQFGLAARDAEEARNARANNINNALPKAIGLADLAVGLEGTSLEPGMPGAEWTRLFNSVTGFVQRAIPGGETGATQASLATKRDLLNKGLSDQLTRLIQGGTLSASTNMQLQQLQDSLATTGTSVGGIVNIQYEIAKLLLQEADNAVPPISVINREALEAEVQRIGELADKYRTGEWGPVENANGAESSNYSGFRIVE